MPKIDFSFSGHVRGYDLERVHDAGRGEMIDVPTDINLDTLFDNLEAGVWTFSIDEALEHCHKSSVDIFDITRTS